MGSTVRNGFSTLNRLLSKSKNRDLSKSNSQLHASNGNLQHLDTTSQLSRIVPLPAAGSNAPFEQTFRITICLPRDQLFVVRAGTRTLLRELLHMVCASKQLDAERYEFRHLEDGTQVFDLDMTVGEVGLNGLRLADRNEKADIKFNADDIMKLRQLSRESLTSSSEFSKGSARQYHSKTVSQYSSTNSLNSMDSATGMNQRNQRNSNGGGQTNGGVSRNVGVPVVPQRKKRLAPRPPASAALSTQSTVDLRTTNRTAPTPNVQQPDDVVFRKPLTLPRRAFHASTPNLEPRTNGGCATKEYSPSPDGVSETAEEDAASECGTANADDVVVRSFGSTSNVASHNRQTIAGSTPQLNQSSTSFRQRLSSDCSENGTATPRKRLFVCELLAMHWSDSIFGP